MPFPFAPRLLAGLIAAGLACAGAPARQAEELAERPAPADIEPDASSALSAEPAPPDPFAALDEPERCERIVAIAVEKQRRRLEATCDSGAHFEFPAALGRRVYGGKIEAGDLRTPEGLYHVAESARGSTYHLFLLLDYPSARDAFRALDEGRISERTYVRITEAHSRGELPPQDTELGGRIGIHGEGEEHRGMSAREDWTFGCIALSDAHVEFLARRTPVGTPVRIAP